MKLTGKIAVVTPLEMQNAPQSNGGFFGNPNDCGDPGRAALACAAGSTGIAGAAH